MRRNTRATVEAAEAVGYQPAGSHRSARLPPTARAIARRASSFCCTLQSSGTRCATPCRRQCYAALYHTVLCRVVPGPSSLGRPTSTGSLAAPSRRTAAAGPDGLWFINWRGTYNCSEGDGVVHCVHRGRAGLQVRQQLLHPRHARRETAPRVRLPTAPPRQRAGPGWDHVARAVSVRATLVRMP